jgi:hypothetical protein
MSVRGLRGVGLPTAMFVLLLVGSTAHADGDSPAIAEALFRSGRELMQQGDYAHACPKFAESNRIDPKLGTLLNLALCDENLGKTASAWAEYVQASQTARRLGQTQREQIAREKATALEPTLPHVVVDVGVEARAQVTLDEQPIGPGAYATPIPVDPGDHVLRATAAGKKPFVESFAMPAGRGERTVHVVLAVEDAPVAVERPEVARPPDVARPKEESSSRTWGFVIGGAGLVAIGIGAYFGVQAFSLKHTAEGECSASGMCTRAGLDALGSLKTSETVSTVTTLAGVAALAVGAYLVLLPVKASDPATGRSTARLRVGPDLGARGLRMELAW